MVSQKITLLIENLETDLRYAKNRASMWEDWYRELETRSAAHETWLATLFPWWVSEDDKSLDWDLIQTAAEYLQGVEKVEKGEQALAAVRGELVDE